MKNLFFLCLLIAQTAFAFDQPTETVKIKTSAICGMCKKTIERGLAFEKGVLDSKLDEDTKIVTVKFNPKKTTLSKIKKNISKSGYDADDLMADKKSYDGLEECCKKDAAPHKD